MRRASPPKGWYLPAVARKEADVDCFDFKEQLVIQGAPRFDVLNTVSLLAGRVGSFVPCPHTAKATRERMEQHWRRWGLPKYGQFDNDTCFQGPHQHADAVGQVSRFCLALDVIPVFAPPREHGIQNAIEGYNALWDDKVFSRFRWRDTGHLASHSDRYTEALHEHRAARIAAAPRRRRFPDEWAFDPDNALRGTMIFIRRTNGEGQAKVLGHRFLVAEDWSDRLIRAEVDLDEDRIEFFGLHRKAPLEQPLLRTHAHRVPRRRFRR